MSSITLKLSDGRVVNKDDFIIAKTLDLKEFGFKTVTEKIVGEELEKILTGQPVLSAIGIFMEDDIDLSIKQE